MRNLKASIRHHSDSLLIAYPVLFSSLSLVSLLGSFLVPLSNATFLLVLLSQSLIFFSFLYSRRLSGVGSFVLLWILFFGMRPLYIVAESDFLLMNTVFKVNPDLSYLHFASVYASVLLLLFYFGCVFAHKSFSTPILRLSRFYGQSESREPPAPIPVILVLILLQIISFIILSRLGGSGRSLYNSNLGAFLYELPMPLQALNVYASVSILFRYLRSRLVLDFSLCVFSLLLTANYTLQMRDISIFRGFWVFGLMILVISILYLLRNRVGYLSLLIPLIALQPLFEYLGRVRGLTNDELFSQTLPSLDYWSVYNSSGDYNIYDTFVASLLSTPDSTPYLLSWLYPFVHIVPRFLWPDKPANGILQDLSFLNGAPYSPGIAGFFWLDGGFLWAAICLFVLGFLLCNADLFAFSLTLGPFRCLLISLLVVNDMFLTRTFLWFFFWQVMYSLVPIWFLSRIHWTKG